MHLCLLSPSYWIYFYQSYLVFLFILHPSLILILHYLNIWLCHFSCLTFIVQSFVFNFLSKTTNSWLYWVVGFTWDRHCKKWWQPTVVSEIDSWHNIWRQRCLTPAAIELTGSFIVFLDSIHLGDESSAVPRVLRMFTFCTSKLLLIAQRPRWELLR